MDGIRQLQTNYSAVYSRQGICSRPQSHDHIQPLLDKSRRSQQSGFTAGRSTVDTIFALRLLSEIHNEFDRPLNVAYLDIKAAFDSVDRVAVWKALRGKGVPDFLSRLIEAFHQNTVRRTGPLRKEVVQTVPYLGVMADGRFVVSAPLCFLINKFGRLDNKCKIPVYH